MFRRFHEQLRLGIVVGVAHTTHADLNFGGYFQDQWSLANRFFTVAGVRLEHNDSFGFFAAPRLSMAAHAHEPAKGGFWGLAKLKANFGLGIKEPSLMESFSSSPFFRGNPNLRPEKAVSFDAGIEQHFGSGANVIEVTYFENRFRNQIGFEVTDYTTYAGTFFFIGKTRARGVETVLRRDLGWHWEIAGAYTFMDSKVLESTNASDPAFAKGQELFRRPRHSGYLDLRWKPGRWTFGATGIFVERRDLLQRFGEDCVTVLTLYGFNTRLSEDYRRFLMLRRLRLIPFFLEYRPVADAAARVPEDFFDMDLDAPIRLTFRSNGQNWEKYLRWVSRLYFLTFGRFYLPLLKIIYRYNRKENIRKFLDRPELLTSELYRTYEKLPDPDSRIAQLVNGTAKRSRKRARS